ncbi:hypothetical protein ACFOEK_09555 [Litoribrevibacter euphylliae]|uniref:Uncharacterized protein n=1 Tax=Litoribrevibacter euphylliae TaxID=1834034 RepID=A0ABV7HEY6_9GAMM
MTLVFQRLLVLILSTLFLPLSLSAATVEGTSKNLSFKQLPQKYSFIKIHGPDGYLIEIQSLTNNSLTYKTDSVLPDGAYRYDVFGPMKVEAKVDRYKSSLNNGRNASVKPKKQGLGILESGNFHIRNQKVLEITNAKE